MKRREESMGIGLFIIIVLIIIMFFGGMIYKCSHNESNVYYGNKNYNFVTVWVGSGSSEDLYCGVITVDDYNKWCNGENGVICIIDAVDIDYKTKINISQITGIKNYGCEPRWLPLNFWR